jgi:DNA recombination protein RmuC
MRTARFIEHLAKVGKHLDGSISAYNAAVGSLERSLLPGARKFAELGIQKKKEIPDIKPVEPAIREIAQKPGKASSPPLAENDGPPETPG